MGQKTNPIGNRLGYIIGWESNWYGGKDYGDKLVEDDKIRKYIQARLRKASISKIIIERTMKLVTVTINTARPGVIIGKGGQEVDKLKEELKQLTQKEVQINIFGADLMGRRVRHGCLTRVASNLSGDHGRPAAQTLAIVRIHCAVLRARQRLIVDDFDIRPRRALSHHEASDRAA